MSFPRLVLRCMLSIALAFVQMFVFSTLALATPAEDAYKQGQDLCAKKDYDRAIKALDKAVSLDPNSQGLMSFVDLRAPGWGSIREQLMIAAQV